MLLKIKLANTWPFRFKNFKDLDLVSRPALFFFQKQNLVPPSRLPQQPILAVSKLVFSHWLRAAG
jgi:hypothetical protein